MVIVEHILYAMTEPMLQQEASEQLQILKINIYRDVAQLVARLVWEQDADSSSEKSKTPEKPYKHSLFRRLPSLKNRSKISLTTYLTTYKNSIKSLIGVWRSW